MSSAPSTPSNRRAVGAVGLRVDAGVLRSGHRPQRRRPRRSAATASARSAKNPAATPASIAAPALVACSPQHGAHRAARDVGLDLEPQRRCARRRRRRGSRRRRGRARRSGRRCRAARRRSPRARRARGGPRRGSAPGRRSSRACGRSSAARSSRTARAGTAPRRCPAAPARPARRARPGGCPASRPTSACCRRRRSPGFSTSSMPSTAWACVSTRRSLVDDRLGRRHGDRLGGPGARRRRRPGARAPAPSAAACSSPVPTTTWHAAERPSAVARRRGAACRPPRAERWIGGQQLAVEARCLDQLGRPVARRSRS